MGWRPQAILREARLNLASGWLRTLLLGLVVAAATMALAYLELRDADGLARFARDFRLGGGYVAVVSGQGESLDAGRCAALNDRPDIVAAGGVRQLGTVSFAQAPGVLFQSAEYSGRALAVWAPGAASPAPAAGETALVGVALAKEVGVREGSYLVPEGGGPVRVAGTIDAERRNPRLQRWLLSAGAPAGPVEECWVEFERDAYAPGIASIGAWFAAGDREPVVRPYVRRDEFMRDIGAEFRSRPQRWGWLAAGGLVALVFLLVSWFRRADFALYLALGTTRVQLLVLLAIEATLIVVPAAVIGVAGAVLARTWQGDALPYDHLRLAASAAVAGALLALALAPVVSLLAARGNVAAMLKER